LPSESEMRFSVNHNPDSIIEYALILHFSIFQDGGRPPSKGVFDYDRNLSNII